MNNKSRRDFLAKIGLLSGAVVAGGRSYASELGRAARFNLSPQLNAVHVYCTGNLNNRAHLLTDLPEAVQPDNAIWLSTGNFVHTNGQYQATVSIMNRQGYHVAGIGYNEWTLGPKKLLELAKVCDFTLVKSHGKAFTADWQTWIKPYQIVHLHGRSIGVVAMGPPEGSAKDIQAWDDTERWAERIRKERICDMVICLLPLGYSKSFMMDCIAQSRSIDVLNCAALTEIKASNRIMKNANGLDVMLLTGSEQGDTIGKQVYGLERGGLILPQQMTHKELQSI